MLKRVLTERTYILLGLSLTITGFLIILGFTFLFNDNSSQSWRGIIPGQTTEAEVVAVLGEPDNVIGCEVWGIDLENPAEYVSGYIVKPCLFAPLMYQYEQANAPDKAPAIHQIHFRAGKVWLIVENTRAYPLEDRLKNEEIIAKYGWPEGEAWSRVQSIRHLKYCEQGVITGINDINAVRVFYFEPMNLSDCGREFKYYLTPYHQNVIIN